MSVDDFANILALLPSDESIKRGTSLWNELAQWLPTMASNGTTEDPSRLQQYLEQSLNEMTKSSATENAGNVLTHTKYKLFSLHRSATFVNIQ